jgi:hypothetical protein
MISKAVSNGLASLLATLAMIGVVAVAGELVRRLARAALTFAAAGECRDKRAGYLAAPRVFSWKAWLSGASLASEAAAFGLSSEDMGVLRRNRVYALVADAVLALFVVGAILFSQASFVALMALTGAPHVLRRTLSWLALWAWAGLMALMIGRNSAAPPATAPGVKRLWTLRAWRSSARRCETIRMAFFFVMQSAWFTYLFIE